LRKGGLDMKNRQAVIIFLLLIICTGYIFSFAVVGDMVFTRVFANKDGFSDNTTIGSIDVSGLKNTEALIKLEEEQSKWNEETEIILQYKEKEIKLSRKNFVFLLEKSVNDAIPGEQNPLLVTLKSGTLDSILADTDIEEDNFQWDEFEQEITSFPARLEKGTHHIKLSNYVLQKQDNEVVSEASITMKDMEQLDLWVQYFPSITIEPNSQFSILDAVEEKKIKTFTSDGLSVIATAIYKTILSTNFSVSERNISRELPSFAEEGFEAKVDLEKNMDFVFENTNDNEYTVEFKKMDQLLYVSLKGTPFLYEYRVTLKDKEIFKPKNTIQFDASLPVGIQKLKSTGKEGFLIKVYRETVDPNATVLSTDLIAEDFYAPINTVILSSLIVNIPIVESEEDTEAVDESKTEESSEAEAEETNEDTSQTTGSTPSEKEQSKTSTNSSTEKNTSNVE
jgi:hypothetical protein